MCPNGVGAALGMSPHLLCVPSITCLGTLPRKTILSVKVVTLACRNTASRWDHDFLAVNISAHTLALGLWFVFFMGLSRGICSLLAMWFSTSWFFWGNWDHLNHWWVIGVRFISDATINVSSRIWCEILGFHSLDKPWMCTLYVVFKHLRFMLFPTIEFTACYRDKGIRVPGSRVCWAIAKP